VVGRTNIHTNMPSAKKVEWFDTRQFGLRRPPLRGDVMCSHRSYYDTDNIIKNSRISIKIYNAIMVIIGFSL